MRLAEFISEEESAAIAQTAKDLVNPPVKMQHRARRDQEREQTYQNAQRGRNDDDDLDEGTGNIGSKIKALYQKIYDQGDDSIDYMYHESPVFAQIWDEYEGDLDSIIAEVDPSELQVIANELEAYLQGPGLAEMHSDTPKGRYKSDGTRSHSTYGSREHYSLGDPETTLGPDSVLTAKDVAKKAGKELDKAFDKSHKKGVAEDSLEEYGDTAKGQKMLAKVHHRAADRVTSKKSDTDPAYARKAQQTQDRAWERLAVKEQGVAEGEKIAGRYDPDDWDAMVGRLKKLAGMGPLKTVWDEKKRVYKNVPVAVQPAQQPRKERQ